MQDYSGKTVILADGDFPSSEAALKVLEEAKRVVCCDGAAKKYLSAGLGLPTAVVGDFDSLDAEVRKELEQLLVNDPNQENNDLAKAFNYCIRQGWRDIVILGAMGRREDHMLGNISWLADFANEAPSIAIVTDYGVFTPILPPGGSVATTKGMQISFFSLDPSQPITAQGVVYPVEDLCLKRWWQATLNEATGEQVTLQFRSDAVIVYRVR